MNRHFVRSDSAMLVPGTMVVAGMAVIGLLGALLEPAPERAYPDARGIMRCPAEAQRDLFSFHALQCWFDAPAGHWRVLSRVSAHGALVVEAEASEPVNAEEIARQFVADGNGKFSEVLVYVQPESAGGPIPIRRIRWTPKTGYELLEFSASSAR